jgi:hypothetical protein
MITIVYSTHKDNIYNNNFKKHLLNSVGLKDVQILEYQNNNQYSLAEVYNRGISESIHDIVVCCHNDIKLETGWGKKLLKDFIDNSEYGIIGKAGSCYFPQSGIYWERMQQTMVGQVYHHPKGQNKWLSKYSAKLPFLIPVVTIDGLFISFDKTKIKHKFDENIGRFHFYDHGFSVPNFLDGVKIGVTTTFDITHESVGQPNEEFWISKDVFLSKYKTKLPLDLKPNQIFIPKSNEKPIKNIGKVAVLIQYKNDINELKNAINSLFETCTNINFDVFVLSNQNLNIDNTFHIQINSGNKYDIINSTISNEIVKNYEFVLIFDQKYISLNNIIHNMVKLFKEDKSISLITPRLHYSDNLVNYDGVVIQQNNNEPVFKNKDSYFNYSTSKQIVDTNFSNIIMFRRELFEKVGGFQFKNNVGNEELNLGLLLKSKKFTNILDGSSVCKQQNKKIKVKVVSGFSDKGGSTTAFINLTNKFNEHGIECVFYGPHTYHLDKCNSDILQNLRFEKDDIIISHFLNLPSRPDVKKIVLACHEKWWYQVGKVKQFWDEVIFLHEQHKNYHSDYKGKYSIVPNFKENLLISDKTGKEKIAGVIGTIEDRKQTHVSITRALNDGCEKVYLFGHIGDNNYYEIYVKPLISDKVILFGHTTKKQEMYDMIGKAYHSSKGEVACLIKDECYLTNTEFFGNEETNNEVSTLKNEEIFDLWKNILNF